MPTTKDLKTKDLKTKVTGLRYWMVRVLEECDQVSADFAADPVHDLRVALRRCRSMADGMMAMDPDPAWKAMKKAGKRLFQRLGALRDVQVMMEWIEKLETRKTSAGAGDSPALPPETNPTNSNIAGAKSPAAKPSDPAGQALLQILGQRESQQKQEARAALSEFDRRQWRQWCHSLPLRTARVRPGSAVFKHLALERWTAARQLHTRALRNRSQVAFHTLRIGIKRFRYIVENFLPDEHKAWSNDLKQLQDLLGDVHDLDVLWATALSHRVFPDESSRESWHRRIGEERTKRIEKYRQRMVGPDSLWKVWRAGLPQPQQIQEIATRRMKLWAKALDPDFPHSERIARMGVALYDGLEVASLLKTKQRVPPPNRDSARACLYLAALLHDVGKAKGDKGHHKESLELIKAHGVPLGWNADDMARAAIVARFHFGAVPTRGPKALRELSHEEQNITVQLAAILRLANALDAAHDGHIRRLRIENANPQPNHHSRPSDGLLRKPLKLAPNEALIISAEGFMADSSTAQATAAERYLLETVLDRPIVIKAMKTRVPRRLTNRPRRVAS